ncbi:MAG: glycine--tRNA ligase [Euryarchaeota archaeon]|nr:glycine--tRNA ligase [Euryarchaeota archaeon]
MVDEKKGGKDVEKEATAGDVHDRLMALLKRRGFIQPAYEPYGGVAGFYDYGPLGAAIRNNIESTWRRYFVHEEGFAEIISPTVAPEQVFRASGHLAGFADPLVECPNCREVSRADHLLEAISAKYNGLGLEEVKAQWRHVRAEVACPTCKKKGDWPDVQAFNLMYGVKIGAGDSARQGYLRPETAQSMFMTFPWLLRYFRDKLPFGAVQIGRAYRNEIAPRQGLLRLREFSQAEAEIFFDPGEKTHKRLAAVRNEKVRLRPAKRPGRAHKEDAELHALGEAVTHKIIGNEKGGNEALAYYIWFTQKFLVEVGIPLERLRFRQHEADEMAHYASDCWDAEFLSERFGWVEIVGIADRGTYDLDAHAKASGHANEHDHKTPAFTSVSSPFKVFKQFDSPRTATVDRVIPRKEKLGPAFRAKAAKVAAAMGDYDAKQAAKEGLLHLTIDGEELEVSSDLFEVRPVTETVAGEYVVPHVVEPSFGLDRITYAVLECSWSEGEWPVLRLPVVTAPVKVGVFPLMDRDGLDVLAMEVDSRLRSAGIATYYDDAGAIGRRYARMDEIGTPWCVTVDYDSLEKKDVTVRERDTTKQERVAIASLVERFRKKG